jgi:outer membrane protein assembly factor BamD
MRKCLASALLLLLLGCGKSTKVVTPVAIDEPDRVLYENALKQLERHDYPVARELLQTLISTYQDSDYFPKAKYALAESFYREGGRESLDAAESAFKDFIIYFRDSDLADDAQMMVAMTHVKRVQSPDRDNTEARLAELELREMINSYPNSDLLEEAKEKLRQVQEVLATGNFKIANQYLHAKNWKASIDRYEEIELKNPDFSKMDEVLFNHAESLFFTENGDAAGKLYAEVVSDYPSSKFVKAATARLIELSLPVPPPNPAAAPRVAASSDKNLLGKTFSVFKSSPAVPPNTAAASVRDKDGAFAIDSKEVKD